MAEARHECMLGTNKLTYDDLATLPDDGKRYEILDGQLFVTPSPLTRHQIVSRNLGTLLHLYVRASVCDMDGDGSIAAGDAFVALVAAVGRPVAFDCPPPQA